MRTSLGGERKRKARKKAKVAETKDKRRDNVGDWYWDFGANSK